MSQRVKHLGDGASGLETTPNQATLGGLIHMTLRHFRPLETTGCQRYTACPITLIPARPKRQLGQTRAKHDSATQIGWATAGNGFNRTSFSIYERIRWLD